LFTLEQERPGASYVRVGEPTRIGGQFFHLVTAGSKPVVSRFRCVSCRRSLYPGKFFHARNAPEAATGKWVTALDAVCCECQANEQRSLFSSHPDYRPELDAFWHHKFKSLVSGAKKRRLEVFVTKDHLLGRYLRVGQRCEVTGVVLIPSIGKGDKNLLSPSVDRIDSSDHYAPDNIQIVATAINIMKNDLSQHGFVTWCKRVVAHNALKEEKLLSELQSI
jgi:hypothetical protein